MRQCKVCGYEGGDFPVAYTSPSGVPVIRRECRTCHNAKQAARYKAKQPQRTAQKREHYAANKDAYKQRAQERWYRDLEASRAQMRESWKRWRDAHPDEVRAKSRRDAASRRLKRDKSSVSWAKVLAGDPCSYCGQAAGTVDHIHPIRLGGSSEWSNLTAACQTCNSSKRHMPLLHYLLWRGEHRDDLAELQRLPRSSDARTVGIR